MGIGELAALTAAFFWATASLLYGKTNLSAWGMNFCKNVIASGILLCQLVVMGVINADSAVSTGSAAWF